jgi:hypothetical protein
MRLSAIAAGGMGTGRAIQRIAKILTMEHRKDHALMGMGKQKIALRFSSHTIALKEVGFTRVDEESFANNKLAVWLIYQNCLETIYRRCAADYNDKEPNNTVLSCKYNLCNKEGYEELKGTLILILIYYSPYFPEAWRATHKGSKGSSTVPVVGMISLSASYIVFF